MENVWNIRENKGLYYILPAQNLSAEKFDYSDTAVIAYIYYDDTVGKYLEYIENIPDEIAIFLISSNVRTLEALRQYARKKKNVQVIQKENRGRDVSALVISSKEIFQKYTYVCFVHDKKAKSKEEQERVEFWIENLWGNTLGTEGYIKNVLQVFEENLNIGLLVPPEPYFYMQKRALWYSEYERTSILAEELGLTDTVIEEKYPPITLGTVFWCRTCAMKKLFDKQWKFEDFVDEPMPGSRTISHAVERVFAYLAQDAGYDTGTVMSEKYGKKMIMALQNEKSNIYTLLKNEMNISSPLDLWEFYNRKGQINEYVSRHHQIYLFGAGMIGKTYLTALREIIGCSPKAFIVTDSKANENFINDIPVISVDSIHIDNSTGIIISVGAKYENEVKSYLELKNYNKYLCIKDLPEDKCL